MVALKKFIVLGLGFLSLISFGAIKRPEGPHSQRMIKARAIVQQDDLATAMINYSEMPGFYAPANEQ